MLLYSAAPEQQQEIKFISLFAEEKTMLIPGTDWGGGRSRAIYYVEYNICFPLDVSHLILENRYSAKISLP